MATGTGTVTMGADPAVKAAVEAGGAVIVDMGTWCTVFVSSENAPAVASLGWEALASPTAVIIGHYVPRDKGRVIRDLRKVIPHSPILNWE